MFLVSTTLALASDSGFSLMIAHLMNQSSMVGAIERRQEPTVEFQPM
jgi:hypothetical protein